MSGTNGNGHSNGNGHEPDSNGKNGRGGNGRFLKGNTGGPGNPQLQRLGEWQGAFREAITVDDMKTIALQLVAAAKSGEPWAVKEFLDRTLGKAPQPVAIGGMGESMSFTLKIGELSASDD